VGADVFLSICDLVANLPVEALGDDKLLKMISLLVRQSFILSEIVEQSRKPQRSFYQRKQAPVL